MSDNPFRGFTRREIRDKTHLARALHEETKMQTLRSKVNASVNVWTMNKRLPFDNYIVSLRLPKPMTGEELEIYLLLCLELTGVEEG